MSEAEQVFFDEGGVRVTRQRFQVGGQTHVMANVSSVKFYKHSAPTGFPSFLFIVAALCLLPAAISAYLKAWVALAFFGLFAVVSSAVATALLRRPPTYSVTLVTGAGEVQALLNEDKGYIQRIVAATNDAIVSRG